MEEEDHPEYRPLYIFPGVELTVQGDVHILAIFDTNKTSSDVDSLIGAIGYDGTKGKSDGCSVKSSTDVIDIITRFDGIAIPAHVDGFNGIFYTLSGQTLQQALSNKNLFAIEIKQSNYEKPQIYTNNKFCMAEVIGSDSHHPNGVEGQAFPGSHFTWVKMSHPSLGGLRLALLDGDISIIRSDSTNNNPNEFESLLVESISVSNAKYLGRGEEYICKFNPWLNTIIGGRGTGKTTTIEFLRLALQRISEIPSTLKNEFIKYNSISNFRHDDGLLKDETSIVVNLFKDNVNYRITWKSDATKGILEQKMPEGKWILSNGDIAQRFPVRFYSQKQILELAKHPSALLKIIDDDPSVNYSSWNAEWNELISKFFAARAKEREILVEIQDENNIKGQLEDINHKLKIFELSDHKVILNEFNLRQSQSNSIKIWENHCETCHSHIADILKSITFPELDIQYFASDTQENKELLHETDTIREKFKQLRQDINQLILQFDDIRNYWLDIKSKLSIIHKFSSAEENYKNLITRLNSFGTKDPSEYEDYITKKHLLEEKIKSFVKKRQEIRDYQEQSNKYFEKIIKHREKLSNLRELFIDKILSNNRHIAIKLIQLGNKITIENELRNILGKVNGFDRDIGNIEGQDGLLSLLSSNINLSIYEKVNMLKTRIIDIINNVPSAINTIKDKRFVQHLQNLSPDQVDRILCWFPDDFLDIKYCIQYGSDFKPIEQGSPGQKTAALLSFILSYGYEPLILDQPEDDLDNKLIYDLIVKQLRNLKQKRQILIVTHNANIVVNGDSENVITLDVRGGQTKIVAQGSLQENKIRDEICRVMEGGRDAFDKRYKRIISSN